MNKPRRLLELDALRGIAALGVVLFHYMVAFRDNYHYADDIFPFFRYFRYGKHGVELFFLISGFVIFMSLERTKTSSDFVFGRFSRLYPTYWATIALSFTVVTIANLPNLKIHWQDALINFTMIQRFFNVRHIDGNYWTLELELSFYIIMLMLWKAKLLKQIDTVAIVWLVVISGNSLLQKAGVSLLDPRIEVLLILKYAHLFILGMLLYKIRSEEISVKRYTIILACLLFSLFEHGWEPTLFIMLFFAVFVLIIRGHLTSINRKPLLFLGTISYSLYLTHLNLGLVTIRTLENFFNINICIFIGLILSIFFAATITFLIEKPAMKFMTERYRLLQSRDN